MRFSTIPNRAKNILEKQVSNFSKNTEQIALSIGNEIEVTRSQKGSNPNQLHIIHYLDSQGVLRQETLSEKQNKLLYQLVGDKKKQMNHLTFNSYRPYKRF